MPCAHFSSEWLRLGNKLAAGFSQAMALDSQAKNRINDLLAEAKDGKNLAKNLEETYRLLKQNQLMQEHQLLECKYVGGPTSLQWLCAV